MSEEAQHSTQQEEPRPPLTFPSSTRTAARARTTAAAMRRICISKLVFLLLLCARMRMLPEGAKIHGNPANELVALVNGKRAASKLPALRNSGGLGCMALQYISECMAISECSTVAVACQQLPEAHITEVYAANCGVELPTVDVITGRLLGCHDGPEEDLLLQLQLQAGNLSVIRGKGHREVGAGFDRRGPFFFWCLLFSGGSANSTFLLEAGGKGIQQTHGCFSAPDRPSCNAAAPPQQRRQGHIIIFTITAAAVAMLLSSCLVVSP